MFLVINFEVKNFRFLYYVAFPFLYSFINFCYYTVVFGQKSLLTFLKFNLYIEFV
jgi:hypothetical protein